jgi:cytochrome c2
MGVISKSTRAIRFPGSGLTALSMAISLILITAYFAEAAPLDQSAAEGATIFNQKCTACHTIGGGTLVGPDLKGVTTRRSQDWLTRWISAPDKMLAAGDPTAAQLYQQYNNVPMPNLGLTSAQVAALIVYLAAPETAAQPTTVPPANLPAGDPAAGRLLFIGTIHFQNGGPPCLACHTVAGVGSLGGGALGPDLSGAFNKYGGDAGLANFLATTPTLTMNAVWKRQPLTPQEQADLREFLKQASASTPPVSATGLLAGLAVAGMLILLVAAQLYWRKRLVAVRQPLVNRMSRS